MNKAHVIPIHMHLHRIAILGPFIKQRIRPEPFGFCLVAWPVVNIGGKDRSERLILRTLWWKAVTTLVIRARVAGLRGGMVILLRCTKL